MQTRRRVSTCFIYDISTGTPIQKQAVMIPNSYNGIAFDPKQNAFLRIQRHG